MMIEEEDEFQQVLSMLSFFVLKICFESLSVKKRGNMNINLHVLINKILYHYYSLYFSLIFAA